LEVQITCKLSETLHIHKSGHGEPCGGKEARSFGAERRILGETIVLGKSGVLKYNTVQLIFFKMQYEALRMASNQKRRMTL
jgi:hypothetical protein